MIGRSLIELIPNLSSEVEVRSYLSDDVIATTNFWQDETSTDPDWEKKSFSQLLLN